MTNEIRNAVQRFAELAQERYQVKGGMEFEFIRNTKFEASYGRKFARVDVIEHRGGKRIFAFIDMSTGDIFKPATYKKPAPHARGNVMSEQNGMEAVTDCGIGVRYLRGGM